MSESINVTPRGRAAFVHVWQPQKKLQGQEQPQEKWRYSCVLLVTEPDLAPLKSAARAVAIDQYGGPANVPKDLAIPWQSCDAVNAKRVRQGKDPYKGYDSGLWAVSFNRNARQGPVGVVDHQNRILTAADNMLYSGCEIRIRFSPFWTNKGGTERLCFGLEHIQVVGSGERLDGVTQVSPDQAFDTTEYHGDLPPSPSDQTAMVGSEVINENSPF